MKYRLKTLKNYTEKVEKKVLINYKIQGIHILLKTETKLGKVKVLLKNVMYARCS